MNPPTSIPPTILTLFTKLSAGIPHDPSPAGVYGSYYSFCDTLLSQLEFIDRAITNSELTIRSFERYKLQADIQLKLLTTQAAQPREFTFTSLRELNLRFERLFFPGDDSIDLITKNWTKPKALHNHLALMQSLLFNTGVTLIEILGVVLSFDQPSLLRPAFSQTLQANRDLTISGIVSAKPFNPSHN